MRFIAKVVGLVVFCFAFISVTATAADAPKKISVLIVDGMNNHDWERGTKLLKAILENSGLFTVDVSTTPTNKNASPEEWAKWQPNFAKYQVVVNNFNGGYRTNDTHWPREIEKSFEDYVAFRDDRMDGILLFC